MITAEVVPLAAKHSTHYTGCQFGMLFPLGTVKIGFSDVPKIVEKERKPQTRIPREAVEPPPRPRHEPWMHGKLVPAKQYTLRTNLHLFQSVCFSLFHQLVSIRFNPRLWGHPKY